MKRIFLGMFILSASICKAQKPTYEDSVKLFTNTRELKEKLIKAGYVKAKMDADDSDQMLSEWHIIDAAKHHNIPPKGMEHRGRYKVNAAKEGNLYRVYDFFPGQINKKLGYQYFSTVIRPYKKEMWRNNNTEDCRLVYNYQNAKPFNFERVIEPKPIKKDTVIKENKTHKLVVYWYHNDRLDSIKNFTCKSK